MQPVDTDLSGKIAIVTGANSGIGKHTAENLARMGAHVVLACRSEERGLAAREEMAQRVPVERLELMQLDQSSQASIAGFVKKFRAAHDRLDILINNAGIYPNRRELSEDGIEMTWATNVMGYFLLTRQLRTLLESSAPARVVFVASRKAGKLDMDDLQWDRRPFGGIRAYMQSKQANRMLAWVFAERFEGTGVAVNVVHPGGVATGIWRNQRGPWRWLLRLAFKTQISAAEGADTTTWLAASPQLEKVHGKYWARRQELVCEFRDMDRCRELWSRCEAMIV